MTKLPERYIETAANIRPKHKTALFLPENNLTNVYEIPLHKDNKKTAGFIRRLFEKSSSFSSIRIKASIEITNKSIIFELPTSSWYDKLILSSASLTFYTKIMRFYDIIYSVIIIQNRQGNVKK